MELISRLSKASARLNNQEQSKLISFEVKKTFVTNIIKVLKATDKYMLMKAKNPSDSEVRDKIAAKIPLLDKALAKLKEKRATLVFTETPTRRSSHHKGEFTLGFNSTMNEYSTVEHINQSTPRAEDLSFNNYIGVQDSFARSVKTLFNSIKTDTLSKQSDPNITKDMKISILVKDESFVDEKLAEIETKVNELKAFLRNSD